jgi:uncharacterized membrane protein
MKLDAWLPAFHMVGVILWVGGLTAVLALLTIHPKVAEASRATLTEIEKRCALLMEVGSTIAITFGLWMAIKYHQFSNGGWLHVKLTAVVFCVLSVHGISRAKIKQFSKGNLKPLPPVLWLLLLVGVVTAAIFGANKLLMRG